MAVAKAFQQIGQEAASRIDAIKVVLDDQERLDGYDAAITELRKHRDKLHSKIQAAKAPTSETKEGGAVAPATAETGKSK